MSRRAMWSATAPASAPGGLDGRELAAPPMVPPSAPVAMLPARSAAGSAIDAQVKLARLADLLAEASGILRELSEVPLADARNSRLMSSVETTTTRPRLLSIQDIAERLQLDARTVRRMRARGQLPPAIDLHGVLRWDGAAIDAWLEGRRER